MFPFALILPSERDAGWRRAILPRLVASPFIPPACSSLISAPSGREVIEIHPVAAVRIVGARIAVRCSVSARRKRGFAFEEVGCRLISMFNRVSLHAPLLALERKHDAPQFRVSGA